MFRRLRLSWRHQLQNQVLNMVLSGSGNGSCRGVKRPEHGPYNKEGKSSSPPIRAAQDDITEAEDLANVFSNLRTETEDKADTKESGSEISTQTSSYLSSGSSEPPMDLSSIDHVPEPVGVDDEQVRSGYYYLLDPKHASLLEECKALVEIAKNYGKKVDLAFEAMIYRKMDFDEEVKDSHVIVICKQ